ncbi:MAG: RagB/SusD family nutrient uptake outer membrane protein [Flavobacterium sp.]|nr:MAG: RagB/SusD family nutrient uptake outer membrane protein [Flavobacterium sp.]
MKTNHKLIILAMLLLALLPISCDDFLEVDVPDSQLTGEAVFTDTQTAEAALLNVYSKLRNSTLLVGDPNGIGILLGAASDELTVYSNDNSAEDAFYTNNLQPETTAITTLWNNTYNAIYSANAVMEGVEASGGIPEADKDRLFGEALFLRSVMHFYLMNMYGDVPYVSGTNYEVNTTIGKLSPEVLYPLLVADLQTAISVLPNEYPSAQRTRANKFTAIAFLSKVYLYMQDYAAAEMQASLVIDNALYAWNDDLSTVFLPDSPATVWQLQPAFAGESTLEAQYYVFFSGPPPSRSMTPSLVSAFETADERFAQWVGTVTEGSESWYYPYKYKVIEFGDTSMEYSTVMRLEELYLIRAEANAMLGNVSAAQADINKIRNRSGLGNTTASTQQQLLEAIVQERRIEFFAEHGQRWFDLKRLGLSNAVLSPEKPGWDATDILLPLPANELLINPNLLPQNPGY